MDYTAENYTAGNYTAGFPSFWEGGRAELYAIHAESGLNQLVGRDKVYSLFLLKR